MTSQSIANFGDEDIPFTDVSIRDLRGKRYFRFAILVDLDVDLPDSLSMDAELFAWLSTFESLEETDNALLGALARGSPRGHGGGGSLDAHVQRLLRADELSSADVSVGAVQGDDSAVAAVEYIADSTQPPPARKRKKRSTWRAKDEIERLRQSVVDLEALIALRSQRQSAGSRELAITQRNVSPDMNVSVWSDVAARQMSRLRESLRENQTLRAQVQHQLGIAKNLARLVQRARGSTSSLAISRNPVPLDDAMLASKRYKLVAAVGAIFQSVNAMSSTGLSRPSNEEFRSTRTFAKLSDCSVQPGTLLARARARRLVPVDLPQLSDQLWGQIQISDIDGSRVKLDHVERFPQLHVLVQSIELSTVQGPVVFRAMGVRARFRCENRRDVIATAGSLWPDTSASADFASVGFDLHGWTVVEPHETAAGFTDVVVQSDCTCIDAADGASEGTALALALSPPPPRAAVLDDIVAASHAHLLNDIDRMLDQILLAAN